MGVGVGLGVGEFFGLGLVAKIGFVVGVGVVLIGWKVGELLTTTLFSEGALDL